MTKAMRTGSLAAQELEPDVDRVVGVMRACALARREPKAPAQGLVAREMDDGVRRGTRVLDRHDQPGAASSPLPINSQGPGDASETTAGSPQAMASSNALGVPSKREVITKKLAPRK